MSIGENVIYQKICLNCKGNWNSCRGIECQCLDGACCCEFNPKDLEQRAFGYEIVKKDSFL